MTNPYAPPTVDAQAMVDEQETAQYDALAKAELGKNLFAVRVATIASVIFFFAVAVQYSLRSDALRLWLQVPFIAGYALTYWLVARALRAAHRELTPATLDALFAWLVISLKFDVAASLFMSLEDSQRQGALSAMTVIAVAARPASALAFRRWLTVDFVVLLAMGGLKVADLVAQTRTRGSGDLVNVVLYMLQMPVMAAWLVTTRRYVAAPTPPHLVRMLRGARRFWRVTAALTALIAVMAVLGFFA